MFGSKPDESGVSAGRTKAGTSPLGALPYLSGSACRALLLSGVLAVAHALALVAQAWALATALAAVVTTGAAPVGIGGPVALLAAAIVARAVLNWATESVSARAAAGAKEELRALALDGALHRGPEWIDRHGPAELTTLLTKGLDSLDAYFTRYLPALVTAAIVPPVVGAWILWADWPSAVTILITVPLIPLFAWLVGRYTESRTAKAADAVQRLAGHLSEMVRALPVLTAFGRARAQGEAVRRVSERHRRTNTATLRIAFLSALVLELFSSLSVALVAVGIGLRLVSGELDLATGLLVLVLAPECYLPLRAAGAAHHASEDGLEAVRRVDELRADTSDADSRPRFSAADPSRTYSLRVRDLYVARRGGHAPAGLSFTAEPGRVLRLDGIDGLGPSGSGKTSTFAALLGFADPESGTIRYGTTHVDDRSGPEWRRLLAWVPQRPMFTGGTVLDELDLAVRDQPERTVDAARGVLAECAAEHLAERSVDKLSTGERQRVAVARALLRLRGGARVLLADEPTAHLDGAAASAVNAAIHRAAEAGNVVLLAAHRPGSEGAEPVVSTESAIDGEDAPSERPPALRELITARGLLGALLGVLSLASGVALTAVSAWLIARASQQPPVLTLTVAVVGVRTFALSRAALRYLERLTTHDAAFRLAGSLRQRLWDGLVNLGPARAAAFARGDGAARLVEDADTIRDLVPRVLVPPMVGLGVAVGAVALQTAVLPSAGLLLGAALAVAGVAAPSVAVLVERRAASMIADDRRAVASAVLDLLEGAGELLSFGAAGSRRQRVASLDGRLARRARRAATAEGAASAVLTLVLGAAVLGCTLLGARAVAEGRLAPELAPIPALVPLAAAEAVAPLPLAARQWLALRTARLRLAPLLRAGQRRIGSPATEETEFGQSGVSVEDVDARWPGARRPAIEQADLRLAPGAHVAVVGPSGSGKSTLLALLTGILAPDKGVVRTPTRVTWCPQEPQLVSTTVRENLRMVDPHADDARLSDALRAVQLPEWTTRLDTVVGTGGTALSGGQAQRLALARALMATDAELVLLDEPTAHLDTPTADKVLANLRERLRGRTVVHVTHRPEEAAWADVIIRVEDGRLSTQDPRRDDHDGLATDRPVEPRSQARDAPL